MPAQHTSALLEFATKYHKVLYGVVIVFVPLVLWFSKTGDWPLALVSLAVATPVAILSSKGKKLAVEARDTQNHRQAPGER